MQISAPYSRRLSRQYPGLFVVLLDQSGSMGEPVEGEDLTKADYATSAINELVYTIAHEAATDDTGRTKKLAYLTIFGYNDTVYPLLTSTGDPLDIQFLAEHTRGTEDVVRYEYDSTTHAYRAVTRARPYWIDTPRAEGRTQMAKALLQAQQVIARWLDPARPAPPLEPGQAARQEGFPPVIVNITDAEHNGDGDPIAVAAALKQQGTLQGETLIFTCHITREKRQPLVFPSSPTELGMLHPSAAAMFEMSSVMPQPLREKASQVTHGLAVPPGARAFVYNANAQLLAEFLKWGTKGTMGAYA
ncbi:MAG TPA: hypothetical protein VF116_12160 [Ktedonobacterales bacterium]